MRPQKIRMIDALPPCTRFVPEGQQHVAEMNLSLDMYEALRLVDAEGLAQEAAARSMEISTPTLCRLLGEARRRVATALRDGWALRCDGGNVSVRPCGRTCPAGHNAAGGPGRAAQHGFGRHGQTLPAGGPGSGPAGGHGPMCGRGRGMGRRAQCEQEQQDQPAGEE